MFQLDGETHFFGEKLIFVKIGITIFFKGKQKRKKTLKMTHNFGKTSMRKPKSKFGSQVTYREGIVISYSNPLSRKVGIY